MKSTRLAINLRAAFISAVACLLLLAFAVSFGLMAQASATEADEAGAPSAENSTANDIAATELAASFTPHGSEYGKSETVAVKTDLSGQLDSIAVDEWIKNPEGLETIEDVSSLQNLVSDDDLPFTRDGESVIWTTGGGDIAYSGTTDRELPFGISYRYELDGIEVDPASLKDVSGELKISIGYENRTNASVSTGWASYDVQDPFVLASVVSFDAEHAQNVRVDHGTVVDQQGTLLAVGVGMPGLATTLGIEDLAELPESVEISATVRGFDMPDITTIATDQVLGGIDAEQTGDVQEQLNDAIDRLGNLSTGVEMLSKGNDGVATATGKIAEGQAAMAENLPNATEGLTTLAGVADAANQAVSGAVKSQGEISQNLAASATAQQKALTSQQEAAAALAGEEGLDDALASQEAALAALESVDRDGLSDAQAAELDAAAEGLRVSIEQTATAAQTKQTAVSGAQAALREAAASTQESLAALAANEEPGKALMTNLVVASKQTEGLSQGLNAATEGFGKVQEGTQQLSEALKQVSAASKQLSEASSKLSAGVSEAIGTVQSTIDEKVDLVNALSDYVKNKPAFGGSAGDMPASTIYLVHATSDPTALR